MWSCDGDLIACENSPSSVTISGDLPKLEETLSRIRAARPDILARLLKVDKAYHSHHMKEVGSIYHDLFRDHNHDRKSESDVAFFSSVTGTRLNNSDSLGAKYWQSNLESPVLFRTAVTSLIDDHSQSLARNNKKSSLLFLEIGPHSALAGPLRQTLAQASTKRPYVSCMIRSKNCMESFLTALGQLHLHNIPFDFEALTNPSGNALVLVRKPACEGLATPEVYQA